MEISSSTKEEPVPSALHETMEVLIEELIKPNSLKNDLFFSVLLVLMKDNNLILLKANKEGAMKIFDYIISRKGKSPTYYEATHLLKGFPDMKVKLIANFMNDVALIILTVTELCKETYSLCLPVKHFISISEFGIPFSFPNIQELTSLVRERLIYPIKCAILNHYNKPSAKFSGLPEDALHDIFKHLPIKDILSVSESCKRLYEVVQGERLWFQLCKRDFPKQSMVENDWRFSYIQMCLKRAAFFKYSGDGVERTTSSDVDYSSVERRPDNPSTTEPNLKSSLQMALVYPENLEAVYLSKLSNFM